MANLTPMMAQYKQIKEKHNDCILMFRLGDFYEMFFDDALEASKILQITLTARGKTEGVKVPMCGVPFHALDNYLYKLTKAGKKVAICDQITEPNGKGIVERSVSRVVTPGTTFDEHILDQKANNYVSAILKNKEKYAFCFCDVTTGDFAVSEFDSFKKLQDEIYRINPAECICEPMLVPGFSGSFKTTYFFPYEYFGEAESNLKKHFGIHDLKIFGMEDRELAINCAAMLLEYLKETQKTNLEHIRKISYYTLADFMPLDEALIRNLDLFNPQHGLIWVLDQSETPMGGRMIRNWLMHPLIDKSKIEARLNKVAVFVENSSLLRETRNVLNGVYDIERLISRLSLGTGNARDLVALKKSLEATPTLKNLIKDAVTLGEIFENLNPLNELKMLIESAIIDEAPLTVREGGMVKAGFNRELDELKSISTEGKNFLQAIQKREIERTGISSLKVKFNSVFGYYIEISKSNLGNVPEDYIRKQTLVNAERFITPELKEYEEKVLNAEERIKALEYEIFYSVRMEVVKEILNLQKTARAIAKIDALASFAYIAVKNSYVRPEINNGDEMEISNSRHPVVELLGVNKDFVPNDCAFDENKKFLLITGPNMGGKSTYLRQVALTVLMAQIGSYVPADAAKVSLVDRIFTRVGASDNLIKGESTFMVEMQEASYILNQATEKSLIILDEIGRGTSTYDGVSIAWAIMEFIHDNLKAKTLFATHYHELIELADRLTHAKNISVAVRETEKEGVVFLYKVVDGAVDKSYGIEVAKLAGLPIDVIGRARGVLAELETKHIRNKNVSSGQLPLFEERERGVLKDLNALDLDNMTPMEAMQKLNEIKKKI